MKISQRWLSSQIMLLMIVCWVGGLAAIHHFWLTPSIRAELARQESSVAMQWIERSLSALLGERKSLGRQCDAWSESAAPAEHLLNGQATINATDLDPVAALICDRRGRVAASYGWVNQVSLAWPKRPWPVGADLAGSALFPAFWDKPKLTGLVAANGRICLFARSPLGPAESAEGYVVFVRPVDWPMLQDLAAITGVTITTTCQPASSVAPTGGPEASAAAEGALANGSLRHWSSGHGMLAAEVALQDTLGRPIGRLTVESSTADNDRAAAKVRAIYRVLLMGLIVFGLVTFAVVYVLFIRPLMILVSRLADREVTAKRDRLASGLVAETAILAHQFSNVLDRVVLLSETDALTGLTNRRQFQILLEHTFHLSRRHGQSLAVLMMDIDHFKSINDQYGHLAGDEVLRMVGETIRAVCRRSDVSARYGGEEFSVILPQTTLEQAVQLAERIRAEVMARLVERDEHAIRVTISIGAAATPELPAARCDDLIHLADQALYAAKHAGRNRVQRADDSMAAAPVSKTTTA